MEITLHHLLSITCCNILCVCVGGVVHIWIEGAQWAFVCAVLMDMHIMEKWFLQLFNLLGATKSSAIRYLWCWNALILRLLSVRACVFFLILAKVLSHARGKKRNWIIPKDIRTESQKKRIRWSIVCSVRLLPVTPTSLWVYFNFKWEIKSWKSFYGCLKDPTLSQYHQHTN